MSTALFQTITAEDWRAMFARARAQGEAEGRARLDLIRAAMGAKQFTVGGAGVRPPATSWDKHQYPADRVTFGDKESNVPAANGEAAGTPRDFAVGRGVCSSASDAKDLCEGRAIGLRPQQDLFT